ncbi:acyltransferase family protein [Vibrio sonorensis]|uniref:acyltransferase family protein n=1 Tax=Vibrio sonorensis TaxID=1004316 RepID=UPI003CCB78DC
MTHNSLTSSEHIKQLDGLRGISALMIIVFHFSIQFASVHIFKSFYLFVDVFFILSGFLIEHCYGRKNREALEPREFIVRRFARLWPLHVFMLSVFTIAFFFSLQGIVDNNSNTVLSFITTVFLVQNWGVIELKGLPWNGVSWSVSCELFVYILWLAVNKFFSQYRVLVYGCLVIVSLLALLSTSPYTVDGHIATHYILSHGVFRAATSFFLGSIICVLITHNPNILGQLGNKLLIVTMLVMGLIHYKMSASDYLLLDKYSLGYVLLLVVHPLLMISLVSSKNGGSRLLSSKLLRETGRLSYGIYLVHPILMYGLTYYITSHSLAWMSWFLLLLTFLLIVCFVSELTYRLVELPGKKCLIRWLNYPRRSVTRQTHY